MDPFRLELQPSKRTFLDLTELIDSIVTNGVLEPVYLSGYKVVDGFRRVMAVRLILMGNYPDEVKLRLSYIPTEQIPITIYPKSPEEAITQWNQRS
jgi:ParB-like chromosome segregation protein Spo0J